MRWLFFLLVVLQSSIGYGQVLISGFIDDSQTRERLPGVHITDIFNKNGTTSNAYGYYSITIPTMDSTQLIFSYIGYQPYIVSIIPDSSKTINVSLNAGLSLSGVSVEASKNQTGRAETGLLQIPVGQIKQIPALLGESDILRAFQLMPGVAIGKEGTSGLFVRGGSQDQNLILLDDIPLYSVNHIGGYVSIFNPDAIKTVDLYKGGFPARYGGRLSSIMDIRMKEGSMSRSQGNITAGIVSSKITLEGPLMGNNSSYIISARRSLFDLFTHGFYLLTANDFSAGYSLLDFNAKINHIVDEKNRIYLSTYAGHDKIIVMQNDFASSPDYPYRFKGKNNVNWGNRSISLRWNRIISPRLFGNLTLGYTKFYYNSLNDLNKYNKASGEQTGQLSNHFISGINDIILKADFDLFRNNHHFKFGAGLSKHKFTPTLNRISKISELEEPNDTTYSSAINKPLGYFTYVENQIEVSQRISANIGLHASGFIEPNVFVFSLQPRVIGNYLVSKHVSVTASFSKMMQPLHLLSNNDAGLPTDLWVPATKDVPPQLSNLTTIGLKGNIIVPFEMKWSIDAYHKSFKNLIDFSENASFFTGTIDWRDKIEKNGTGKAMGLEVLLQKETGNTTGWISYTISKNTRQFENINQGQPFAYKYDRRHDFSITANHKFNEKISLAATWVFASGNAVTLPGTVYDINVLDWAQHHNQGSNSSDIAYNYREVHLYSTRNNYRMPPYHRFDISIQFSKEKEKGIRSWIVGLYNAYNRINPYYLYFDFDKEGTRKLYSFGLFPILPSISYNYRF